MSTYVTTAVPSTTPAVAQPHTVRWLARKVAGLTFPSFDALIRTAFRLGRVANEGARLDAAQSARLRAAARALWERTAPSVTGGRAF